MENNKDLQNESNVETSQYVNINLVKKAQKRVNFRIHCWIYILVNLFLWLLWFFIFRNTGCDNSLDNAIFLKCVIFTTLTWLLILIAHYLIVFKWNKTLVEKELVKLQKDIAAKQEKIKKLTDNNNNI